jgi:Carboxypeptidase regulatory-like domain
MRFVFVAVAACAIARAGVVRGVVSEHVSGLPLARTSVRLQPVPRAGAQITPLTMRTGSSGTFVFQNVPDGLYLLIATREPYFPAGYGQRRPEGQGTPIEVTKDSDLFAELRMYRKGAITGRVLDENGIGMENVPVVAYRARLPLRAAASAVSDDRGVYRIHGLDPGKYWVRTVAHTLDDGEGRLPTFGREGREISESHIHVVMLDEDTPEADVRPFPGRLLRLRGRILCDPTIPVQILVTLSSELGRRTTEARCMSPYVFEGLAPAFYEISAQKQMTDGEAGFMEMSLDGDSNAADLQLAPPATVDFRVRRGGGSFDKTVVKIVGHRQDLSESGEDREIPMHTALAPGHWELTAVAPEGSYVQSMTNPASLRRAPGAMQPPDWFDLFFDARGYSIVTITLSDQAATMQGAVMKDAATVAGAPVFLWPVEENARRSLHGFRQMITDVDGHFKFTGLPPGDYRMLATFDVTEIDEEKLDEARAMTVHVDAGISAQAELALWVAP